MALLERTRRHRLLVTLLSGALAFGLLVPFVFVPDTGRGIPSVLAILCALAAAVAAGPAAGFAVAVASGTLFVLLVAADSRGSEAVPLLWGLAALVAGVLAEGLLRVHRAELDARQAEVRARQRLELTLERTGAAVFEWDEEADLLCWSRRLVPLFGLGGRAPASVSSLLELIHADDRDLVGAALTRAGGAGSGREIEFRLAAGGGSPRWLALRVERGEPDAGRPWRPRPVVGLIREVSAQKELEARLTQAQKLEAVGQLAAGIAHDFNNLLGAILGFSELALATADAERLRHALAQITDACERGALLTRRLLAFSRGEVVRARPLDLDGVVAGLEPMLRRLLGARIHVQIHLCSAPCAVFLDPGQLEQIVLNLTLNARDAMPAGGTLTIASERTHDGRHARLIVSDTGVGMDAETQARVFEPFFTTKAKGRGSGLGLATVAAIVEGANARIELVSAPAAGTQIAVQFPIAPAELDDTQGRGAPARGSRSRRSVLLVDDEDPVRHVIADLLEGEGYEVLAAADGREALALADLREGKIDVLLSDVLMPGLSGRELALRVRERYPALAVVFMSGYFAHPPQLDGHQTAFIEKPFTAQALVAELEQAIESATAQDERSWFITARRGSRSEPAPR